MNVSCPAVSAPGDCGLGIPALAVTGGIDAPGIALIVAVVLVVGVVFVLVRRRR